MLPVQIIDDSFKATDRWKQQNARSIIENLSPYSEDKKRDELCYKIFNSDYNDETDYLTQYGDYVLPAKMRWIPIIRPKLQRFFSLETRRSLQVKVFAVDESSINKRLEKKKQDQKRVLREQAGQRSAEVTNNIITLQQLSQQLATLAESENPEDQEKAAQLQQQLPIIDNQIKEAINIYSLDQLVNQKDIEEIERYYKYDYKSIIEKNFEVALMNAIDREKLNELKVSALMDKYVTGKEYYFVDWIPGNSNPTVKKYDSSRVYYDREIDVRRCQDLPWFVIEDRLSPNQILDEFGNKMPSNVLSRFIKNARSYGYQYSTDFIATPYDGALDTGVTSSSFHYKGQGNTSFVVRRLFWKVNRKVYIKQSPNPYDDTKPFLHVIKNPKEVKEQKGEKLIVRYIRDLWSGVAIGLGTDMIFDIKKHDVQYRDPKNIWNVEGPLVGRTHNGLADKEYSPVWATKDAQLLYNIVNYHKELMLAVSGARGFIMDMSQKPDSMSRTEWMYEYKMGVAWIQSLTKSGKPRATSFNQFKTYDNTITESIIHMDNILANLDQVVLNIIGTSRESMGQTSASDQVGTYKMAVNATSLISEIIFYEHDLIQEEMLERYMNLAKYAWKDGIKGSHLQKDLGYEIMDVKDIPDDLFFNVKIANRATDVSMIEDLRQQAQYAHARGELSFENLVKTYKMDSISELENMLEEYTVTLREIEQQAERSVEEAKSALKQKELETKARWDMEMQKMKNEVEMMKINVQKAGLELENKRIFVEDQNTKAKIQSDHTTKMADVQTERDVEAAYLQEQKRSSLEDERIRRIELQLEALSKSAEILLAKKDGDTNRISALNKTESQAKKTNKEKIKD